MGCKLCSLIQAIYAAYELICNTFAADDRFAEKLNLVGRGEVLLTNSIGASWKEQLETSQTVYGSAMTTKECNADSPCRSRRNEGGSTV